MTWRRILLAVLLVDFAIVLFMLADGWYAFGKAAEGARLERMQASANWRDGVFVNAIPLFNPFLDRPERWFDNHELTKPAEVPAYVETDPNSFNEEVPFRVTWFGHSIVLIEMGGVRLLTDPVWAERVSPYTWIGPKRWYPPSIALKDLPEIDAVLISHDHYDHLDMPTIRQLRGRVDRFVVPLGVGAHLEYWGLSNSEIVELDWWESVDIGGVTVTATPARHASGRIVVDNDKTLWMGFALRDAKHSVYFSGDTGLFPELKDIGRRLGPFDVTMIEVGSYGADWPDWHIGPEQAVLAHNWVRGDVLMPVHWALFDLARHAWTAPIERTLAAADKYGYSVLTPRPGTPVVMDLNNLQATERWWPEIDWESGAEAIVATGDFDREPLPLAEPR